MAIYTGETVNDAIEKGLEDLGIEKKHAKISVLQEPRPGILGKFSKEAKVEIIVLTDNYIKKKEKLIKLGIIAGAVLFVFILFSVIFGGESLPAMDTDNNQVKVPVTVNELESENYEEVIQKFKDAGFTNINTRKIEDLITGWLTKDSSVEKVTIDGREEFSKGEAFPKDVPIEISYHTFPPETERENIPVVEAPSSESSLNESVGESITSSSNSNDSSIDATVLSAINEEIAYSMELNHGWAYGKIDADGNPVENGVPSSEHLIFVTLDEILFNEEGQIEVQANNLFESLSKEEKNMLAGFIQGIVSSAVSVTTDTFNNQLKRGFYLTIRHGQLVYGNSKVSDYKSYSWN